MAFEYEARPRRQSPVPKDQLFARFWNWHADILLEKRASGRVLRLYALLLGESFHAHEQPFNVTSAMARRAGVDRRFKAEILRQLEEWGMVWVDYRDNKNPRVVVRRYKGRGVNPFLVGR